MKIKKLKVHPSPKDISELTNTLEEDNVVSFKLHGVYYGIALSNDSGYIINVYASKKDLKKSENTIDGSLCKGHAYDVITYILTGAEWRHNAATGVIKLEEFPTLKKVLELARVLEVNKKLVFKLNSAYYLVLFISDGSYEISMYNSYNEFKAGGEAEEYCVLDGCSYEAVTTMLPPKMSTGNGGKNDFYSISECEDLDDLAIQWKLDPFMFNQLKTMLVNVGNRHDGTSKLREARKSEHYGKVRVRKEQSENVELQVSNEEALAHILEELPDASANTVLNLYAALKSC